MISYRLVLQMKPVEAKNKRDRGTVKFYYHRLTLKKGLKVNCDSNDRCAANDFL